MKIRTDFVTNSSSSSFIAIIKNGIEEKKFEDSITNHLLEFALWEIQDTGKLMNTEEQVTDYLLNDFCYNNQLQMLTDDNARKKFVYYNDYINKDYNIYMIDDIDDCSSLHNLLSTLTQSSSEDIIIKYNNN